MRSRSPVTRGSALRALAALPAALLALRPLFAFAQSLDALKRQYRYRKHPTNHRRCVACAHYTARSRVLGQCTVLEKTVNWVGSCTAWTPKVR